MSPKVCFLRQLVKSGAVNLSADKFLHGRSISKSTQNVQQTLTSDLKTKVIVLSSELYFLTFPACF